MVEVEAVVGVIPAAKMKTGMFSSKTFALVVTDRRLLIAEQTSELSKRRAEEAKEAAKATGKGFVGQLVASTGTGFDHGRHYLAMDPAAILAESPGNGALGPGDVREVKVDRKTTSDDDGNFESSLRITVKTARGDTTWNTSDETPARDEARALLARVFGAAVK
jgi:hypothetical protein